MAPNNLKEQDNQAESSRWLTPQTAALQKETEPKAADTKHSIVTELAVESFRTFCDDISGMFGLNIKYEQLPACVDTLQGLKKHFREPVSVHYVKAEGALESAFHIAIDRDGLFTLAGIVSMHSEQMILEDIKSGTPEKAGDMSNFLTDVGQALVGAWDRVFREKLDGHNNFTQTNVFIGNLWSEPEKIGLSDNKEITLVPCRITIAPYPPFKCGAIFPKELLTATYEPEQKKAEAGEAEKIASVTAPADDDKSEPISETIRKMVQASPASASNSTIPTICAKDIMQKDILWGTTDDSVQQTITNMQKHNAGYVLVGHDGVLEGIVSKSDIQGAISPYLRPEFAKWRRPLDDATLQIKVKWITRTPVHTIIEQAPLAAIMENMCRFGVRCLPVVDYQGKVQGLVTVFDIFKILVKNSPAVPPENKPA